MNSTIKTILYSWFDKTLPEITKRDLDISDYLAVKPKKIIVVTGFRRVGKTYILYKLLEQLTKQKDRKQVIYTNFDDERIPRSTEFLTQLLPTIKMTTGSAPEFLFLDEIQNMPDWGRWVRRIYDNENLRIFLTGSSSRVSSRELPTELRGRCLEVHCYPLSFSEFLRFKKVDIDMGAVPHSEKETVKAVRGLDEYLTYGGMPEVVLTSKDRKFEMLQQYFGTVVRRDIVERFKVKNEEGLKALLRLLLNSTQYSISKLYNTMKSLNYEIGKTTLLNYINYVETSYFIKSVPIFSPKVKDQLQYPRKLYFIDNGFINALSTRLSKNTGRLYENLVAVELQRRYSKSDTELFYWKDRSGKELDFIVKEGLRIKQLIQVCYNIDDYDTKKREIDGLLRASKVLNCKDLLVITGDYEGVERIKNKRIKFIPLYRWLFNPG